MAIKGPLTGVRVLDFSQAHAGPFGTQILGDMGAEVIKIESLRGDVLRGVPPYHENDPQLGYYALGLNRNKRGITLDLYATSGKEAFYDLVKVSDVVWDNFRAGSMERMGAGYETLSKINPRIICCSLSGWGTSGPYESYPSADDIAQATGGLASLSGEPGGMPIRSGAAVSDISMGLYGAMAVGFALYQREHTGKGMNIDINLLEATISLLNNHFGSYFISGRVPQPQGSVHPTMPLLGFYKTRNGHIAIGASWPRIARVIGKEWMIDDPRFKDILARVQHREELQKEVAEALLQADTEDWLDLLRVEDMPVGPVNTLDKVLEDPQVVHLKTVIEMKHPKYGKVRAIRCPIRMPGAIEGDNSPTPLLGEHTEEVLKEVLGYSEEKIARIKREEEEHFQELQDTKLQKAL